MAWDVDHILLNNVLKCSYNSLLFIRDPIPISSFTKCSLANTNLSHTSIYDILRIHIQVYSSHLQHGPSLDMNQQPSVSPLATLLPSAHVKDAMNWMTILQTSWMVFSALPSILSSNWDQPSRFCFCISLFFITPSQPNRPGADWWRSWTDTAKQWHPRNDVDCGNINEH